MRSGVLWLLGVSTVAAGTCQEPRVRKEWRSLTVQERIQFTKALNCLVEKPAKFGGFFPDGVVLGRYDEFVALHVNQTSQSTVEWTNPDGTKGSLTPKHDSGHDDVHGDASILPWHRYALSMYEDALVNECGWTMGMPYWNWFLDTKQGGGNFMTSPIFDPVSGLGGNGAKLDPTDKSSPYVHSSNGGGCITDGPLKNRVLRIGPYGKMVANNTRCLRRDLSPQAVEESATKKVIGGLLKETIYANFSMNLAMALHNVGHGGVGGEMSDEFNSINDPLFFCHHGNLDYFWALWQSQDAKRLTEFTAPPGTVLDMGIYAPVRMASEVLDTQNRDGKGILCYRYEGLKIGDYGI